MMDVRHAENGTVKTVKMDSFTMIEHVRETENFERRNILSKIAIKRVFLYLCVVTKDDRINSRHRRVFDRGRYL